MYRLRYYYKNSDVKSITNIDNVENFNNEIQLLTKNKNFKIENNFKKNLKNLLETIMKEYEKKQHSLKIVCEMLLIRFQNVFPLHTIPSWHYTDLVVYYYLVLKIVLICALPIVLDFDYFFYCYTLHHLLIMLVLVSLNIFQFYLIVLLTHCFFLEKYNP